MDAMQIHFSEALSGDQLRKCRDRRRDLERQLASQLLSEMERDGAAAHPAMALRRAEAAHLRWEIRDIEPKRWLLQAAPTDRLAGAFDYDKELLRIWLTGAVKDWLADLIGQQAELQLEIPEALKFPESPPVIPQAIAPSPSRWPGIMMAAIGLLVVGTLTFTVFRVFRLVEEVQTSYTEIQNTVDRSTEEILDKVERGITTSDRVVNMVDKVKGMIVPADTSGQ